MKWMKTTGKRILAAVLVILLLAGNIPEGIVYAQEEAVEDDGFAFSGNSLSVVYREGTVEGYRAVSRTEGAQDAQVSYQSGNETIVSVNADGSLTLHQSGSTEITATQSSFTGTDGTSYRETRRSYQIVVEKASQPLFELANTADTVVYGEQENYEVAVQNREQLKGELSFSVDDEEKASFDTAESPSVLTIHQGGTVTVTVTLTPQGEDAERYQTENRNLQLTIQKAEQDIPLVFETTEPEELAYEDGLTYQNVATGGSGSGEISYEIADQPADEAEQTAVVDSADGTVSVKKTGTVTVRATKEEDACYQEQSAEYTLVIGQKQDELVIADSENKLGSDGTATVTYNELPDNQDTFSVTGGSTNGTVSFEIVNQPQEAENQVAVIDSETRVLTVKKAGTVTVRATMAGDETYAPVSVECTITIKKASQEITFEDETSTADTPVTVLYGNAYANPAAEVVHTDAADGKGYGTGEIVYTIAEGTAIATDVDGETGALLFADGKTGLVKVTAQKQTDDCYEASAEIVYYIEVMREETPQEDSYTVDGDKEDGNAWYKSNVTIAAPEGYWISDSESLEESNVWRDALTVVEEGIYTDKKIYLKNKETGGITEAISVEAFQIDKNAPGNLEISYTESLIDKIIERVTFGYYHESPEVTLYAEDLVSGIASLTYCIGETLDEETATEIEVSQMNDEGNGKYSYHFSISEEFKGKVFFKVKDKAGNETAFTSDGKVLVVDRTGSQLAVSYSDWQRVTELPDAAGQGNDIDPYTPNSREDVNLYYAGEAKLTFKITEANFDEENVVLTDNGEDIREAVVWSREGETDVWEGCLTLTKEGEHVIYLSFQDNSGNDPVTYQSEHIIVDRDVPQIAVSCEGTEKDGIFYANTGAGLTVSVKEKNFRSSDVKVSVTAVNAAGESLAITENGRGIEAYFADGANWSFDGEAYTASVTCAEEASYKWSVSYEDLAHRKAETKTCQIVTDDTVPVVSDVTYEAGYKNILDAQGNICTEENATEDSLWVYDGTAGVSVSVTEANFFAEDINVKVYRDGVLLVNGDDYSYSPDNWTTDGSDKKKHTLSLKLGEKTDGTYQVQITYVDRSGNSMETFLSRKLLIDRKLPEITVTYDNITPLNGSYYKNRTATIKLKDTWLNLKECTLSLTGKDTAGNIVVQKTENDVNWQKEAGTGLWVAELDCNTDAHYEMTVTARDFAGNETQYEDSFTVDGTAPAAEAISYEEAYTGDITRMVDGNNRTVTAADKNTRFIYRDEAVVTFRMKEANFNAADAKVTVFRDGKKLSDGDGFHYDASAAWSREIDTETFVLAIGKKDGTLVDGNYQVKISYTDLAGNSMEDYISNVVTIDTVTPVVSISYDNNKPLNKSYYGAKRTAAITVEDKNITADDITVLVTTVDIEGNEVSYPLEEKLTTFKNKKNTDVWTASLTCDLDANYSISVSASDMAEHTYNKEDSFTVDTKKADTGTMRVEYSTSLLDKILKKITFGYYQSKVTVTLYADDMTSGVDYFDWEYGRADTASDVNVEKTSGRIKRKNITYTNNGRTAVAKFTLTADEAKQYRGNISFSVTDMAGNTSALKTDTGEVLVVDTISPTRVVTFSPAKQVVNKKNLHTVKNYDYSSEDQNTVLYYDAAMSVNFRVTEANFNAEDIVIKVNGKQKKLSGWKQDGDTWSSDLTISGEGDYIVTMEYTDRSSNKMAVYTSDQITIDTDIPQISVKYSPDKLIEEIDENRYYDAKQTATITIKEHNFRAEDVEAEVIAQNVAGETVATQDYTAYLKKAESWVDNGDEHTAVIEFPTDANYTFDIDYTDLALHQAGEYTPDKFTIDTAEPENLTVSYSTSVLEQILGAITFGFYDAKVTVTVTAEDSTAGIHQFQYSYLKADGVSNVNTQMEDVMITEDDITYSNGDRLATATFLIPSSELKGDTQFNGTVAFSAMDRSGLITEFEDDTRIIVDNIAPTAEITYSEPVAQSGEIAYYDGEIEATITVDEANFYEEDVAVTVEKDGQAARETTVAWSETDVDTHLGRFTLSEDGDYIVYVSYTDHSGNQMEEYHSEQLTIDTTSPTITVSGIRNHSANRTDEIGFEVVVEDTNFDVATFAPKLMAEVMGEDGKLRTVDMSSLGTISTLTEGSGYSYRVPNLEQDAVYTLTCEVADMSGNSISELLDEQGGEDISELKFSVNRNGSTYTLGEETRAINGTFVKDAVDVVVTEINVDELKEAKVTMFKNDKTVALEEGSNYRLDVEGNEDTWYAYTYDVYADNFAEDGVYRLTVQSEDAAGNIAENTLDSKNVEISFGVDKTQPNLVIANLESGATYPVENLNVVMQATDNMKLASVEVSLDGQTCASWGEEEVLEKTKDLSDYSFDISGNDTHAHTVNVVLKDAAGNEASWEVKDFYVTTNMWVRFYNNKLLFFGTIGGVVCAAVVPAGGVMLYRRRKRK